MKRGINALYRAKAEEFASALLRAFGDQIHTVVLYGSTARKRARRESDIDLLVVGETRQLKEPVFDLAFDIMAAEAFEMWLSVVYHTREEIQRLYDLGSPFLDNVLTEGVFLFDDGTAAQIRERVLAGC